MLFMGFFDACAAAGGHFKAGGFKTNDVEELSVVIPALGALDVIDFLGRFQPEHGSLILLLMLQNRVVYIGAQNA